MSKDSATIQSAWSIREAVAQWTNRLLHYYTNLPTKNGFNCNTSGILTSPFFFLLDPPTQHDHLTLKNYRN